MMRDPQFSSEKSDEFSNRIMQLLRDRIVRFERDELLDYLDFLMPKYETPAGPVAPLAPAVDQRKSYDWSEFVELSGEDFIRNAYLCVVKREADNTALQAAARLLDVEERSRVLFLAALRYSEEGDKQATEIKGLWFRYQLARLEKKPLIGVLFSGLMKRERSFRSRKTSGLLSRRRKTIEDDEKPTTNEQRFIQHYNDTLKNLKREVAEALTADVNR